MSNDLVVQSNQLQVSNQGITSIPIDLLIRRMTQIDECVSRVMVKDVHYGIIPGCGDKPTLLKAGAEKMCAFFSLSPKMEDKDIKITDMQNGHREYSVTVQFYNINTGEFVGSGVGSCSTMESKFRFRNGDRQCPDCGERSVKKSKQGVGWFCWSKIGGCGKTFEENDHRIKNQKTRIEHDNPADYYNTCLKMAKKRAQIDGILTITGTSDRFTQDVEDMPFLYDKNAMKQDAEYHAQPNPEPQQNAARPSSQQQEITYEIPTEPGWLEKVEDGSLMASFCDALLTVKMGVQSKLSEMLGEDHRFNADQHYFNTVRQYFLDPNTCKGKVIDKPVSAAMVRALSSKNGRAAFIDEFCAWRYARKMYERENKTEEGTEN